MILSSIMYKPPFEITSDILQLSQSISHELGILAGAKLYPVPIKLRRENKIKTIHSSLAIEGNTLTIKQVTGIIDGQKVIGHTKDITEVQNAIKVYDNLSLWDPISIQSLKQAHFMLMKGLINSNGEWRQKAVGIFKDKKISHIAPSAKRVEHLMIDLFDFTKKKKNVPWLLKACIFHYELEFIHPFEDGNGRMGRLWQQLLLMKENSIFEFISVESLIRNHLTEYYQVLEKCDHQGQSTEFVEFSLKHILSAIKEYTINISSQVINEAQRLNYAKTLIKTWFNRKQYMTLLKNISSATASRDLTAGIQNKLLIKKGEKNQILYKFSLHHSTK